MLEIGLECWTWSPGSWTRRSTREILCCWHCFVVNNWKTLRWTICRGVSTQERRMSSLWDIICLHCRCVLFTIRYITLTQWMHKIGRSRAVMFSFELCEKGLQLEMFWCYFCHSDTWTYTHMALNTAHVALLVGISSVNYCPYYWHFANG